MKEEFIRLLAIFNDLEYIYQEMEIFKKGSDAQETFDKICFDDAIVRVGWAIDFVSDVIANMKGMINKIFFIDKRLGKSSVILQIARVNG